MNKIILLIIIAISLNTYGQEIEPRSYASIPKGLNAVVALYSVASGNVIMDATSPIQGLDATTHALIAGYVRTLGIFDKLARVQITVPFVYMAGSGDFKGVNTNGNRTGFADLRVRVGYNIFGSPALAPKDFQRFKEETVFGTSFVISAPTGQYFNDKFINLGSNRWGFKPELGFSQRYKSIYFEAMAGVWFFTANKEFIKTNTLKQDPLFSFQSNLIYNFPSGIWAAISGGYANGGSSSVNNFYKDDLQNNVRLGATLSAPLGKRHSVKTLINTALITKSGGSFTSFSVAYQYIWF
jgi:hypothetical protein